VERDFRLRKVPHQAQIPAPSINMMSSQASLIFFLKGASNVELLTVRAGRVPGPHAAYPTRRDVDTIPRTQTRPCPKSFRPARNRPPPIWRKSIAPQGGSAIRVWNRFPVQNEWPGSMTPIRSTYGRPPSSSFTYPLHPSPINRFHCPHPLGPA